MTAGATAATVTAIASATGDARAARVLSRTFVAGTRRRRIAFVVACVVAAATDGGELGAVRLSAAARDPRRARHPPPRRRARLVARSGARSLFAIGCIVGALLALDVRDWRCYPVALLYPPTVENIEYGAVGPILVLLVALGWRYRERTRWHPSPSDRRSSSRSSSGRSSSGLRRPDDGRLHSAPRRRRGVDTRVVGRARVQRPADYPDLIRRLSDIEAENSYSTTRSSSRSGVPGDARGFSCDLAQSACSCSMACGRATPSGDRRSLTLALAAGRRDADPLASLPRAPRRAHRARPTSAVGALVRAPCAHDLRGARLVPRLATRRRSGFGERCSSSRRSSSSSAPHASPRGKPSRGRPATRVATPEGGDRSHGPGRKRRYRRARPHHTEWSAQRRPHRCGFTPRHLPQLRLPAHGGPAPGKPRLRGSCGASRTSDGRVAPDRRAAARGVA